MALPPNERVWMSAMYRLMWLRIGLITSAADVARPWHGCSLKNLTILFVKVVVLDSWSVKSEKITKVLVIRIIVVLVLVTKISLVCDKQCHTLSPCMYI